MTSLWEELKRRNVVRVGAAYVVIAWILLQAADLLFDIFAAPDWVIKVVAVLLLLGFPIACLFAWAFELTPDGLMKSDDVAPEASVTANTGRTLERATIGPLLVAVAFFAWNYFSNAPATNSPDPAPVAATDAAGAVQEMPSIAVLPFVDMSPDKDQEYFTDGISEELLNVLSRNKGLKVAARTSSFAFKNRNEDIREIGALLGVNHVLEGSIRKSGLKIRITAQLIKVEDGFHLWSATYDRELTDVFAVQDEISAAIYEALKLHLFGGGAAPKVAATANAEVYERYLKAKKLIHERSISDLTAAIGELEAALAIDPDYGPAHVAMAMAYTLLSDHRVAPGHLPAEEVRAKSAPHFARALELTPDDPVLYAVRGFQIFVTGGPAERAYAEYDKALALNPNLALAYTWRSIMRGEAGDTAGAIADDERAYALDSMSTLTASNLVLVYIRTNQIDKAKPVAARLRQIDRWDRNTVFANANFAAAERNFAESFRLIHEALTQSDRKFYYQFTLARDYTDMGLYDRALAYAPAPFKPFVHWYSGAPERALAMISAMGDQLPSFGPALRPAAALAATEGDLALARTLVESALTSMTDDACSMFLAIALRALGDDREDDMVARCLRGGDEIVDYRPYAPNAYDYLAQARALAGDRDGAIEAWEKAYELGGILIISPDNPMVGELIDDPRFKDWAARMKARARTVEDEIAAMEADGRLPDPFAAPASGADEGVGAPG